MASRSERAARVAGALVAACGLGLLIYKAVGPLLVEYDAWQIATGACAVAAAIVGIVIVSARRRRRSLASRIKRR